MERCFLQLSLNHLLIILANVALSRLNEPTFASVSIAYFYLLLPSFGLLETYLFVRLYKRFKAQYLIEQALLACVVFVLSALLLPLYLI